MTGSKWPLTAVFDGWQGHQQSLVNAIAPLSAEQLRFRPVPDLQSVGQLTRHISLGRIGWFARMGAPGSAELVEQIIDWQEDGDGNPHIVEESIAIAADAAELVRWLELTWDMIDQTLVEWTVNDLAVTYRHTWNGDVYAIPRQWTLYRILTHDVHHGGQISLMLGMQGIEQFELGGLFGHITLPPLADAS